MCPDACKARVANICIRRGPECQVNLRFERHLHKDLSFRSAPPYTHRSPKRPKTVLSGGRLREMTWWSQTNFFRDHLYHCYGFYLNRLDTPSSFSLISENQLIFCFSAIFDTKFSRYHRFEGTSSLSSVFVQLNSVSSVKKLWKNWVSYLSGGLMLPATNLKKDFFWLHGFCHGYIHGISHAYHTHF